MKELLVPISIPWHPPHLTVCVLLPLNKSLIVVQQQKTFNKLELTRIKYA